MKQLTEKEFLRDVSKHQMHIRLDQGLYREVCFNDGTFNMAFRLITFPGYLVYVGDTDRGINPHYWMEKLEGLDHDSRKIAREYDQEVALLSILRSVDNYSLSERNRRWLKKFIRENFDFETQESAYNYLSDFDEEMPSGAKFQFSDVFEIDMTTYSRCFLWACYAIQWGIKKYKAFKAEQEAQDAKAS